MFTGCEGDLCWDGGGGIMAAVFITGARWRMALGGKAKHTFVFVAWLNIVHQPPGPSRCHRRPRQDSMCFLHVGGGPESKRHLNNRSVSVT